MGYFKKILDFSLKNNDQNSLDNIILAYISKKQAKQKVKTQSEIRNILEEHRNLGNKMELSDECIYNVDSIKDLIKHNCKGRLTIKRLKDYEEEKHKMSTSKVQKENI